LLALYSCKPDEGEIVLKILNTEVSSYGYKLNKGYFKIPELYDQKSKSFIRYSITNNSTTTYYFNQNVGAIKKDYGIGIADIAELMIQDDKGVVIDPRYTIHCMFNEEYSNYLKIRDSKLEKRVKDMGYEPKLYPMVFLNNKSFFIHPNETLYFEDVVWLPGNSDMGIRFIKNKSYTAHIEITSDSTNYKKDNTRGVLKTIEANGYKVFHGTIKSENVPVVFKPVD
jgi:hypothetical protein